MGNLHIIRDTREKDHHGWVFNTDVKNPVFRGTIETKLKTGDYCIAERPTPSTLRIFDKLVCVERKESVVEVANNLMEPRFYDELERMSSIKHAYIVCEFNFNDFAKYPFIIGIPRSTAARIKLRGAYLIKKVVEIQARFPTVKWMFAGGFGRAYSEQVFKEIVRDVSFTTDWLNNPAAGTIVELTDNWEKERVGNHYVDKVDQKPVRKKKGTK